MNFTTGNVYHIYNQGNDRQAIFLQERNYIYFLQKVRKYIIPHCDVLAWVLMPNHFHFLIYADERSELILDGHPMQKNILSEGFRLLLSSYSKAINKQEGKTGNLIKQNTRSKCVYDPNSGSTRYAETCFTYIHQNPIRAGLVDTMTKWEFSSFKDYAGLRNGTLCNSERAKSIIGLEYLHTKPSRIIGEDRLRNIW